MKREYEVKYYRNEDMVIDILNTMEMAIFIILSRFDSDIKNIEVKESDFCE